MGKITGSYYRILLDKEWDAFWKVTGISALLYAAATLLQSTTMWLSEILAVRYLPAPMSMYNCKFRFKMSEQHRRRLSTLIALH